MVHGIVISVVFFPEENTDDRCSLLYPWHGTGIYMPFYVQDHRQFKQRYYEFLDYYRAPNGPIFLYICGEASCNGIGNNYLAVS